MVMDTYALRVSDAGESIAIRREEFEGARDERLQVRRLLHEETLFDQLATNVTDWLESMVRAAAKFGASYLNWSRTGDRDLTLRVANVLSAAMSFVENVEKDDMHMHHKCGMPMCTIARELRNRLQHGMVNVQPVAGLTNLHIVAPQKLTMPVNFTQHSVELRVPWRDVRDDIIDRNPRRERKRRDRFQQACRLAFPNLDTIDVVVVVHGHLRCLSDLMNRERKNAGDPDKFVEIHRLLVEKAQPLNSSMVRAVSSGGMDFYVSEATRIVTDMGELRRRNERLPVLELIQFGSGSPTQGDLRALFRHVEHLLEEAGAEGMSLAEARDRLDLADDKLLGEERLGEAVRRLYNTAQDASGRLLESTIQLRRIESALTNGLAAANSTQENATE